MIKEWIVANPKLSIVLIGILVTLATTLITKKFTDQRRMKEIRDQQKENQKLMKEIKGDIKKMSEIQKEMMGQSLELMKHSFKPMIITFIPLALLLIWIRQIYSPIFGGWIWWYLVSAVVSSIILRKLFKVV